MGGSAPWPSTQETIGNGLLPTIVNYVSALLPLTLPFLSLVGGDVLYTGERVCDVALNRCMLSSGNPRRVGNLVGRVEGSNGGQRESVYEQPGTEVDDSCHNWRVPSKWKGKLVRGIHSNGNAPRIAVRHNSCSCTYWND